jgi:hypothetical protein
MQCRLIVTEVSRQLIGPIFLHCLTLEGGTDRLSQNVTNYQSMMHNNPEEQISHCVSYFYSLSKKNNVASTRCPVNTCVWITK